MNAIVPSPATDVTLSELASLGMRATRVVTRMMEIELAATEIVVSWLPEPGGAAASLSEAVAYGQGVDTVNAAMAEAAPRVEVLARAHDRLSRSVRRSVALLRRIEAGWPRTTADDRAAMVRRQVARGVGEAIRRATDGEAAERLFDDLAERLEDPSLDIELAAMPVEEVVRRICRDLGLTAGAIETAPGARPPGSNTS